MNLGYKILLAVLCLFQCELFADFTVYWRKLTPEIVAKMSQKEKDRELAKQFFYRAQYVGSDAIDGYAVTEFRRPSDAERARNMRLLFAAGANPNTNMNLLESPYTEVDGREDMSILRKGLLHGMTAKYQIAELLKQPNLQLMDKPKGKAEIPAQVAVTYYAMVPGRAPNDYPELTKAGVLDILKRTPREDVDYQFPAGEGNTLLNLVTSHHCEEPWLLRAVLEMNPDPTITYEEKAAWISTRLENKGQRLTALENLQRWKQFQDFAVQTAHKHHRIPEQIQWYVESARVCQESLDILKNYIERRNATPVARAVKRTTH